MSVFFILFLISLSIAPQFGYFVIDNLAVGAVLDLGLSKWNAKNNGNDATYTSIEFQPFVRYYLPVNIFFQAKAGLGSSKSKYDNSNTEYKYNTTSLAVSAGYAFFLTDNIAIEPEIGYGTKGQKNTESKAKDLNSGIFLRVGFQIYLGSK